MHLEPNESESNAFEGRADIALLVPRFIGDKRKMKNKSRCHNLDLFFILRLSPINLGTKSIQTSHSSIMHLTTKITAQH